nr:hypothetical protein OG513_00245 [Streptomyces sp. NBC_00998]
MLARIEAGLDFGEGLVPAAGVECEEGVGEVVPGQEDASCVLGCVVDGGEGVLRVVTAVDFDVAFGQGELQPYALGRVVRFRSDPGCVPCQFERSK